MASRVFLLRLILLVGIIATIQAAFFEPCNICRSPNVVRNSTAAVNVLYLTILSFGGIRTCGDLDLLATTGWISDSACLRLQTRRAVRESCDCGQINPTQSTTPSRNLISKSPSPNLIIQSPSPIPITESPNQVRTSAPIENMMMMRRTKL